MRNKILVDLNQSKELNIYEVISERGNYTKFSFTNEEIQYLASCGYFKKINSEYGLLIDFFEEQAICDTKVILKVLEETRSFSVTFSGKLNLKTFNKIIQALELAIKINSCVYFIL